MTYAASKAAVNMLTAHYAQAFPAMRINVVARGFAKMDLNGHTGMQSVEEAAEIIVRMAQTGPTARPAIASMSRARCPGEAAGARAGLRALGAQTRPGIPGRLA